MHMLPSPWCCLFKVAPDTAVTLPHCFALHADCNTPRDLQAWCDYGCFCVRAGAYAQAHTALQEALSLDQGHSGAAAAMLCLSLVQALGVDCPGGPDPAAGEAAEVLGHSLKDREGTQAVVPWALLALLYRSQGEAGWLAAWEKAWPEAGGRAPYCRLQLLLKDCVESFPVDDSGAALFKPSTLPLCSWLEYMVIVDIECMAPPRVRPVIPHSVVQSNTCTPGCRCCRQSEGGLCTQLPPRGAAPVQGGLGYGSCHQQQRCCEQRARQQSCSTHRCTQHLRCSRLCCGCS